MKIAIRANETQRQELLSKGFADKIYVEWFDLYKDFLIADADVFFDLLFDDVVVSNNKFIDNKPVFVNGINCVCKDINKSNYARLNAWSGFLLRPVIEIACCDDALNSTAIEIFNKLGRRVVFVDDEYGLIAARIIAMIINEAYYALEENVSTKEQIDIAMKLGTNYPYGPFEWSERIGLKNVLHLLQKLATKNCRYTISNLLVQESQQFKFQHWH